MSDAMTELFTAALGSVAPWRVERVGFAPEAHEIRVDLVCEAKRLPCPRCSKPGQPCMTARRATGSTCTFFSTGR